MPIWNVIDNRKRKYRWKTINAVIEPVAHDNSCEDSDHADDDPNSVIYLEKKYISLNEAINWAHGQPYAVTLYLYDRGDGM